MLMRIENLSPAFIKGIIAGTPPEVSGKSKDLVGFHSLKG
jgi:hypothetical protein